MQYEPGGSTEGEFTTWRQCRKRVFVCWNMRGVHLLRQASVHSDGNTEKKHQATRAFCDGIVSFGTLVVKPDESFRLTLYSTSDGTAKEEFRLQKAKVVERGLFRL
jgi:hypothetical protein